MFRKINVVVFIVWLDVACLINGQCFEVSPALTLRASNVGLFNLLIDPNGNNQNATKAVVGIKGVLKLLSGDCYVISLLSALPFRVLKVCLKVKYASRIKINLFKSTSENSTLNVLAQPLQWTALCTDFKKALAVPNITICPVFNSGGNDRQKFIRMKKMSATVIPCAGCPVESVRSNIRNDSNEFNYHFRGSDLSAAKALYPSNVEVEIPVKRTYRILPKQGGAPFTLIYFTLCVKGVAEINCLVHKYGGGNIRVKKLLNQSQPVFHCIDMAETFFNAHRKLDNLDKIVIRFLGNDPMFVKNIHGIACREVLITPPPPAPTSCLQCGYSQYADAGIVGGTFPNVMIAEGWEARPHEFPFQVLVGSSCGGVLINANFVITAAHCITSQLNPKPTLGEHRFNSFSSNRRTLTVAEYIVHEAYNSSTFENDIALIRLATPINFTHYAFPVCMPSKPAANYVGQTMVVSGWGYDENFVRSTVLRYVTVPVMSQSECDSCMERHIEAKYKLDILPGMVCAGLCDDTLGDSCGGDSGGPLVIKNRNGCFELAGIVSWGVSCSLNVPGVYADLYYYMDWLTINMI